MKNIGRYIILWCMIASLGLLIYDNGNGVVRWGLFGFTVLCLILNEIMHKYLEKSLYTWSFPTGEYIKDILREDKNVTQNTEKLIEVIDGCMDIIQSKHLDMYGIKEHIFTTRQISCTINAIVAADEHREEAVRREILDIIEKRTGKLSVSEIYILHIILCRWKQSTL